MIYRNSAGIEGNFSSKYRDGFPDQSGKNEISEPYPLIGIPWSQTIPRVSRRRQEWMQKRSLFLGKQRQGVQPSATSRAIINTNPKAKQIVPRFECAPSDISGINSSTTTYIMAPAAKASI